MHDDIIEHTSKDRGYNEGYEAGQKRVHDLLGEAAEWYRAQMVRESKSDTVSDSCYLARLETVLYAQNIIKRDAI